MKRPAVLLVAALLLMNVVTLTANAQNKDWREVEGKPLTKFDGNCALASSYPRSVLSTLVTTARKKEKVDAQISSDRAFAFDLNHDRQPEYFVPLVCGGTGNCTWAVFALRPARMLGVIGGHEYVYVHARSGRWPDLITYGHMNVVEGVLTTYKFRKGRYVQIGSSYPTDTRGGIFGRKVPKFLERANPGCKSLGH